MLLQSHTESLGGPYVISLLPALPKAWPSGRVTGLRARGGVEVDIAWRDGRLTYAELRRVSGDGDVIVRLPSAMTVGKDVRIKKDVGDTKRLKVRLAAHDRVRIQVRP